MDRIKIKNKILNQADKLVIDDPIYKQWVFRYTFLELEKDLGEFGDITSQILLKDDIDKKGEFCLVCKADGIAGGLSEIEYFLQGSSKNFKPRIGDLEVDFQVKDGEEIQDTQEILTVKGRLKDLFAIERVTVNFIARMSGIATLTREIVNIAKKVNPDILIVPTRKTLWGLLDKKACTIGGGGTHRLDLSDAILIKDNHLAVFDNDLEKIFQNFIVEDFKNAKFIEIEVNKTEDAIFAAEKFNNLILNKKISIPVVIMFDNMNTAQISESLNKIKAKNLYENIIFEASGGINKSNILNYTHTNVDVISMGMLTNNAKSLDFSMELSKVY